MSTFGSRHESIQVGGEAFERELANALPPGDALRDEILTKYQSIGLAIDSEAPVATETELALPTAEVGQPIYPTDEDESAVEDPEPALDDETAKTDDEALLDETPRADTESSAQPRSNTNSRTDKGPFVRAGSACTPANSYKFVLDEYTDFVRALCASCRVLEYCREYYLDPKHDEVPDIRGGLSADQREVERSRRAKAAGEIIAATTCVTDQSSVESDGYVE